MQILIASLCLVALTALVISCVILAKLPDRDKEAMGIFNEQKK